MKLISWNINGIRAIYKKGFLEWLQKEAPDILALQEIKAEQTQFPEQLKNISGYECIINSAQRKGYSGTAIYTKIKPNSVKTEFGAERFDKEGRVIMAEFEDFIFFNIYFPNGKMNEERLQYKLDFYEYYLAVFKKYLSDGKEIIITGDVNTAHQEIDLARPKENENVSGFLMIERKWLDKLLSNGFTDCFRKFNSNEQSYTWWSARTKARERNVGWRIDYFFCSNSFLKNIESCNHLGDIFGSDHCPIVLNLKKH